LKISPKNNIKTLREKPEEIFACLVNSLNRRKRREEIKPDEVNKYLCEYILSVKRKDGEFNWL